ncbi:MarR family winged helix-turn-helix transcriptional regulator [Tateyamaria sp. SN6-1]|uniref:MarR family winged helix-turn-helix transcriptional regulator n=1 Tax=Tateyamaria sp. SN6-1 TaxID=3092148 RepID=UPI0039F56640
MRVMLISERTPPEHQHVIKFNPLDFHTLGMVRAAPGVRAGAVVASLGIAPTTASSVIGRLISRGLIQRRQCSDDRRAYELYLTDEGQQIADTIFQQDLRNMGLFLSALTEREQEQLLKLMGKVVTRVAALEEGASG